MASSEHMSIPFERKMWKRPPRSSSRTVPLASNEGPLRPDVDPPPRSRPILQAFSFLLVFAFAALQLLPATHFRHPADRSRSWMPFIPNTDPNMHTNFKGPLKEQSIDAKKHDVKIERINVVSWTECLDLRVLAVLVNSTISSSRLSEQVYLSLFVPEDVKLSYYKMKVLFPDSNMYLFGQNEVKEKLKAAAPGWESLGLSFYKLIPFVIPSTKPLRKFIFVSPHTIIQGRIEELFGYDLGHYAIAAAEDCSKRLGDYVDIAILNAVQRTAAKTWISEKPYDKDACIPDLKLLLIDPTKLDGDFLDSVLWWNQVLNLQHERNNQEDIVIAVALYNKYLKLPDAWKLSDSRKLTSETKVVTYDGPAMRCSQRQYRDEVSASGVIWKQYLPAKADLY